MNKKTDFSSLIDLSTFLIILFSFIIMIIEPKTIIYSASIILILITFFLIKHEKMRKKMNNVLKISLIVTLFIGISLFVEYILYPSIMSYKLKCLESEVPIEKISGYFNDETKEICILEEERSLLYNRVLKHELIHLKQSQKGRIHNCSKPLGVVGNEIEAYLLEHF